MELNLRQATESDKPYLFELRKLTMSIHLENSGLCITDDEHMERLNDRYQHSFIVFHKQDKIGYIKYVQNSHEINLIQLQIDPKFQSKGFGSGIVNKILGIGRGKMAKLSVLKTNPAVALYKRLGFQIVGEDKYEYHMQKAC